MKEIGEGMASKAFIDDEGYILLVGKRDDSFNIYKDLKANMDLLEGKIKCQGDVVNDCQGDVVNDNFSRGRC